MSNAAAAVADELIAEVAAEGALEDEPAAEVVEEVEPEVEETLSFGEIPDEIEALLAEEDEPTDEDEPEPPAAWEETFDDEQTSIRVHKAEKKAAALEKQLLARQRVEWAAEIEKVFGFADPKLAEKATSRKEALRMAKAEHDLAKRGWDRAQAHYEQNNAKLVAEQVAEAEAKLKAAWGEPITGPGQAPAEAAQRQEQIDAVKNATTLHERILAKMRNGQDFT